MKPASLSWASYLKFGAGRRLSMIGERLGIDWLTYNPIIFESFHNDAVKSAPSVIKTIAQVFPNAKAYIDVGAGSGAYAVEAKRLGLQIAACEHSKTGRKWTTSQGVPCHEFDLTHEPPSDLKGPFDLSYCFGRRASSPRSRGSVGSFFGFNRTYCGIQCSPAWTNRNGPHQ